MNSRKTLTCNLFQLPQDIFRVIFQYLSVRDIVKGEEAFLNNQELLSLYRSSLAGFTLKEVIRIEDEELISWIVDHNLLVETLELRDLRDLSMNLLNQSRSSLKSIYFLFSFPAVDNSSPARSPLGHFPSLTSVTFYYSHYFTKDQFLSFFSHNPQLESVEIEEMPDLSNEILPHFSNYCPKIKILSLYENDWVNDETISLLTQQTLYPNLKSLNLRDTRVRNQETLRQFILSHPLLCGLSLPNKTQYSDDFLVFYLRKLIFPSILSQNNNNDLESHSLAISSIFTCFDGGRIFDGRFDVVNPEIFSVDILSHFYRKGCSFDTLDHTIPIFSCLSKFPSMIDSILQSQFIPIILNDTSPHGFLPSFHFGDILINCGVFHDYFPLLVEKYQTHPNTLFEIFHVAIKKYFSVLTKEELQTMIPIVLNQLRDKDFISDCLKIISKLLREPSSQLLIDPNDLLLSLKSIKILSNYAEKFLFECLKRFLSVNENYQQLLIESNLIPQIMKMVKTNYFIDFLNQCLSSRDGLLVDHLVDSGVFQYLLSYYSQFSANNKNEMESLFKQLFEFKNNKYSDIVREMELPTELRVKLFEKKDGV